MKKETKIQLIIIVGLTIILGILIVIAIKELDSNNQINGRDGTRQEFGNPNEEKIEKETKASDVDAGQEVTENNSKLTNGTYYLYKDGEKTDYTAQVE